MTERERLITFMHDRDLDYRELARLMKFSPTAIYGYLGGAWDASAAFWQAFGEAFGSDALNAVLPDQRGR